ncbi:alkaline phosphatase family protein [Mesorhizobium sp. Cs1299R1N1]|uniref:alkaline phosphatase family protein n=1 Tax=Mesorhizobium sp. Cs1299R1N1 TaxID=3015172 RepID=UPI00301DCF58
MEMALGRHQGLLAGICRLQDYLRRADTFETHGHRFPNMRRLADAGLRVRRLKSGIPATSVPGRATMLTGVGPEVHGIYGNHIFRGDIFVAPLAADLQAPTLATHAKKAGLDVAAIGQALVDPADTSIHVSPWWLRGFVAGHRFSKMVPPEALAASRAIFDPKGRLAAAGLTDMEAFLSPVDEGAPHLIAGLALDQFLNRAAVALLGSDQPPDLILTEIEMPDAGAVLHPRDRSRRAPRLQRSCRDQRAKPRSITVTQAASTLPSSRRTLPKTAYGIASCAGLPNLSPMRCSAGVQRSGVPSGGQPAESCV